MKLGKEPRVGQACLIIFSPTSSSLQFDVTSTSQSPTVNSIFSAALNGPCGVHGALVTSLVGDQPKRVPAIVSLET